MPLVIKADLGCQRTKQFKENALRILKQLCGAENCIAMVGDTASKDGYGALANEIAYVPFQVDYLLHPGRLNTGGYGWIDPDTIAWDWAEVMAAIEGESAP